jgi:dihydroorotase
MTAHKPLALVNARLVDPAQTVITSGGVLVIDGAIADLGPRLDARSAPEDADIIDCGGDLVAPGLIDMRAFLGEPGQEHRETIATASRAAAAGGVTTIIASPTVQTPIDDPAVVDFLLRRARDTSRVRVLPAAAVTKGLAGREIAEMRLLREAGAVAFGNGSNSIANAQVMRRALAYARDFDGLIMHAPQDQDLAEGGVANEGEYAMRLGLPGVPREAEAVVLDRDLRLVALTGARYHAEIVSSELSVDSMRRAKEMDLPVTCGATINHLALNEADIGAFRTNMKLSPPLRADAERRALIAGLRDGVIDVVISDHTPHDVEAKRVPFADAAPGSIGLETLLAAALRAWREGDLELTRLWRALSLRPAEILGLPQGRLARGAPADLVRVDPDEPWVVDAARSLSRSRNAAFDGARMQGRVKLTLVAGRRAHD